MDYGVHGEAVNVVGGSGDGIRARLRVVLHINTDYGVHGEAVNVVGGRRDGILLICFVVLPRSFVAILVK